MRIQSVETRSEATGASPAYVTWFSLAVLCLLALLIRLPGLDHLPVMPFADELYTVLAARGWLVNGVPSIAMGEYTRAESYTILIAQIFKSLTPGQPHHIRLAQPRAMGSKPGDQWVVPLCNMHHRALHDAGNEPVWWQNAKIDPLAEAERLWQQHRGQ